jgi:quinoprotein glucose dehydrogenase
MARVTPGLTRRELLAASSASFLLTRSTRAQSLSFLDTEWHAYANDNFSTRYVPLDQINAANFNDLQIAWRFRTDNLGPAREVYNQCTPVVAKGRIFVTAGQARDVLALDAATGEELWLYRHDEGVRRGPRTGSGHGVSYWTDGSAERIIYVTPGYQMISLDAKTGRPDSGFGRNGVVDLREDDDQQIDLNTGDIGLHSTPVVTSKVIVVGAAHLDGRAPRSRRNVKGYTRGFDVKTGKRLWIFHTIPRRGEFGYDSWITEGEAEVAGNTDVWGQFSADEQLGMVYIGVESATGDEVGIYRKGNALFAESIVALDLYTGVRKWHFQMVHHGLWDRDTPCASVLCDIRVNGRTVKAIAQPSKQAFLYVLNRETGEPIWPIEERPVPKGDVPGEWYAPTQPFPTKPPAYDVINASDDVLADFTPAIKSRAREIASHYKMGPAFTPPVSDDGKEPWATFCLPSLLGGSNWPGASYDPENQVIHLYSQTVLMAIAASQNPNKDSDFEIIGVVTTTPNTADSGFGGRPATRSEGTAPSLEGPVKKGDLSVAGLPLIKPPYGRITAIDLSKGEILWQTVHGETPDAIRNHPLLKGMNIPRTGQSGIGGTLTTKSLVICADTGVFTDDKGRKAARLRAYDKQTGAEKGAVFIPGQGTGAPMSYMLAGRQYIVLSIVAEGGGSEFIAFRLPQNG